MQRKTTTRKKRARKTAQLYRDELPNNFLANGYHIEPCEALLLVYADEDREPVDGEPVFMHYARFGMGCGCIDYGVFRQEADGCFSVIHDDDGSTTVNSEGDTHEPDNHRYLMRLVGAIRQSKYEFFEGEGDKWAKAEALPLRKSDFIMSDEEYEAEFGHPPEATATGSGQQARINHLKSRLSNLLDEGESWNESGIFRLRREIYDLERKSDANEWPEVIGDE